MGLTRKIDGEKLGLDLLVRAFQHDAQDLTVLHCHSEGTMQHAFKNTVEACLLTTVGQATHGGFPSSLQYQDE